MTSIQSPKPKSFFLIMIASIAGIPLLCGALLLVVFYNQTVNLNHGIHSLSHDIQVAEARNAELKDEMLKMMGTEHFQGLAEAHQLVQEKNPQYLEVSPPQWVGFASHY